MTIHSPITQVDIPLPLQSASHCWLAIIEFALASAAATQRRIASMETTIT
jgi:hypothetical protein